MNHDKVVQILLSHGMSGVYAKVSDTSCEKAITNIFEVTVVSYDSKRKLFIDHTDVGWKHAVAIMQISTKTIK